MAAFEKARPMQAKLRVALYGRPGSGKTFTSLLVAEGLAKREKKRIAYIDTEESGTDMYAQAVPSRAVHPEAFDFDVLKTQSMRDIVEALKGLSPKTHGVIVLDSITHVWEAAMNAAEQTSKGTVKFGEWSKVKRPYKKLVKWLIESDFHVLICGRMKNVFEEDENKDIKKVGVTMNAERDTLYEPQIAILLEPQVNPKDQSTTIYKAYVEKDRSGVLAGRTLANLTYSHFEPVVALLSGEQFKLPDSEETAMKDAELMEQEELETKEKKRKKSSELLATYSKRINDAKDLPSLNKIANELQKKRGSLLDPHHAVLLDSFNGKAAEIRAAMEKEAAKA